MHFLLFQINIKSSYMNQICRDEKVSDLLGNHVDNTIQHDIIN
jgi:hypothetical protein